MKKGMLEHIVCPQCGSHLSLREEKFDDGEIVSGTLTCSNRHKFPIKAGLPRLVGQKIRDEKQEQTRRSFGRKWIHFAGASFGLKAKNRRFRWKISRYGFKDTDEFKRFLSDKRIILDAGCGLGMDVGWYARLSPKSEVFGLEISKAIEVAQEKYGSLQNVYLVQGDLTKLPFQENYFDFIISDGVLHHTPNTEKSFKYLSRFLKRGGEFSCLYL